MKHVSFLFSVTLSLSIFTATAQQNADILDSIAVPYAEAKHMVANYAPKAGQVELTNGSTETDTRALWFSATVLKALIEHVEASGGDGIRFYLASYNDTYPDGISTRIPPTDYWGRNTLLAVPTAEMVDSDGQVYHEDRFETTITTHNGAINQTSGGGRAYNDAGMCPPAKGCKGAKLL